MKKLFTLLVLFIALSTVAQTVEEYKQQEAAFWKKALQEIESQITTGILYTKATPFSNLYNYNTEGYNTANASLFKQALSELYRSSDKTQFTSVEKLEDLKKSIYLDEATNTIPLVSIGVLNTSFNFLFYDEENEDNGGLHLIDGVFKPIEGKPSVFTRHISLISPQKELITPTIKGTVRYKINPTIFFNKGKKIKRLTANFGTNSDYTLITDSIANTNSHFVRYNTFGDKKLKFTITYTDNSELITYADITLIRPKSLLRKTKSANCAKTSLTSYTSTISYRAWDELRAVSGKLNYKIFFGDNNQTGACDLSRVRKPFIVIDGFDPGDTRRIETIDCERDPICKKLNADSDGNFDATNYKSIVRSMKFGNNIDDNIVKKLQEKNYDVIIINLPTDRASWDYKKILHDFGADYIERNAMSFISFIKDVNTKLAQNNSTEKLVVVGPSMGGQITRYALAYMEKKEVETGSSSWNHNTRLWVSVDSPHQGANIPLAVQGSIHFLGFTHDDESAKAKYKQKLRAPATKQMLLNHYDYSSRKSTYFTKYQNGLIANGLPNSNGYPTKSRNIAIVNGSMAGRKTASPGQRFLDMRGYIDMSFWPFDWTVNLFTIKNNYQQEYNQHGMVFDIGASKLSSNFYSSIALSRTNLNTQGSLDVVPGGLFNSGNDLKEEIIGTLKEGVISSGFFSTGRIRRRMYTPSTEGGTVVPHAFIPTHSALDTKGFSNWYQSIRGSLVCTNQTPFDTYYGESTNTEHVSFTQSSKNWLFKELDGIEQPPVPNINGNTLRTKDALCGNKPITYTLDPCDSYEANSWSVSYNLQIISFSPRSITVKTNITGTTVNASITANLKGGKVITKRLNINQSPTLSFNNTSLRDSILAGATPSNYPRVTIRSGNRIPVNVQYVNRMEWKNTVERTAYPTYATERDIPFTPCYGSAGSIEDNIDIVNIQNRLDSIESINYNFVTIGIPDLPQPPDGLYRPLPDGIDQPSDASPIISFSGSGLLKVEVKVTNECGCHTETNVYKVGTSSYRSKTRTKINTKTLTKPDFDLSLFPNPANNYVTIRVPNDSSEILDYTITLTNLNTNIAVYSNTFTIAAGQGQSVVLPTSYPQGIYIATISSKYGKTSKKLIIANY